MKCVFKAGNWSMNGLTHAFSVRFDAMPALTQQDEYLENLPSSASNDGYAYVSLVTKDKVHPNVKISTRCSFLDRAAPLVVLPKNLVEKDGRAYYSDCLEVVIWKNGINVWKLWEAEDGTVKYHILMCLEKDLEPDVIHDLSVEIQQEYFVITVDGFRVSLRCEEIYDSFHLGITGCEGPCKFYSMEIEE